MNIIEYLSRIINEYVEIKSIHHVFIDINFYLLYDTY